MTTKCVLPKKCRQPSISASGQTSSGCWINAASSIIPSAAQGCTRKHHLGDADSLAHNSTEIISDLNVAHLSETVGGASML